MKKKKYSSLADHSVFRFSERNCQFHSQRGVCERAFSLKWRNKWVWFTFDWYLIISSYGIQNQRMNGLKILMNIE